jgi:hypothetical protein
MTKTRDDWKLWRRGLKIAKSQIKTSESPLITYAFAYAKGFKNGKKASKKAAKRKKIDNEVCKCKLCDDSAWDAKDDNIYDI